MSNGICLVAQNNLKTNYVRQAYALALSALAQNPRLNISLVTDDNIPTNYRSVFDKVIPIPWGDLALHSKWKVENRWKVYHTTPYENTIVLDVDMLILNDIGQTWTHSNTSNLLFTNRVKTYRDEIVSSRYYRKTFDANDLPDVYAGFYQFSKCDETLEFFKLLDVVMQNWETFYAIYAPKNKQKWCSIDVSVAIALKILDKQGYTLNNSSLTFTHMKPYVQNLQNVQEKWTDMLSIDYGDGLYINGYKQTGVFHYVEDEFLTDSMLSWLEEKI